MSVITAPELNLSSFRWTLVRNAVESRSVFGSQSIEGSAPLWNVSMVGVIEKDSDAMALEAWLEALEGKRNQTAIHHVGMPEPTGTMRGALTLNAASADGTRTLSVTGGAGQAGKTMLKGDLIGIGSGLTQQVVRIAANATADGAGVIALTLNQALKGAFASGTEVRWDKPTALFRQQKNNNGIEYVPGLIGQPWSLDLIEDTRP